ncbi:hypothetical protein Q7P37_003804 [Cladosporium fusiforme]
MVKLIPNFEITLNREVDRLTTDNEQLRSEIEHLKAENARLGKMAYGHQKSKMPLRRTDTPSSSTTPSYLRPTAASKLRARDQQQIAQADLCNQEDDRSPFYHNGKLVRVGGKLATPGYMDHTEASRVRARFPAYGNWEDTGVEGEPLLEFHPEVESPSDPPPASLLHFDPLDPLLHGPNLASTARLEDDFHDSCEGQVFIPHRLQSRLLMKALRIAQDEVFNATRTHWPFTHEYFWSQSPRQVRLGFGELRDAFGVGGISLPSPNGKYAVEVGRLVFGCTPLRNAVAHPRPLISKGIDELLTSVQKLTLAFGFGDTSRSMRVRKLRDILREESRKVYTEIETYYTLLTLDPKHKKQWKAHHEELFRQIASGYQMYQPGINVKRYTILVRSAANDWSYANSKRLPGESYEGFDRRIEEASSYGRETSTGHRRNSITGVSSQLMYDKEQVAEQTQKEKDWAVKCWSNEEKQLVRDLGLIESAASRDATWNRRYGVPNWDGSQVENSDRW